jgi:uncharacterized protein HemY
MLLWRKFNNWRGQREIKRGQEKIEASIFMLEQARGHYRNASRLIGKNVMPPDDRLL